MNRLQEDNLSLKKENQALKNVNLALLSKYAEEHSENITLRVKIQSLDKKIKRLEKLNGKI